VCFYSKLTSGRASHPIVFCAHFLLEISAELRTQSYSALIFCWKFPLSFAPKDVFFAHFLLEISAGASGKKKKSRATTIFPANFLAFFLLGDPYLSFRLSRNLSIYLSIYRSDPSRCSRPRRRPRRRAARARRAGSRASHRRPS
jgi:hypothetical protein